jgi:hypothetical protein
MYDVAWLDRLKERGPQRGEWTRRRGPEAVHRAVGRAVGPSGALDRPNLTPTGSNLAYL